MIAGRFLAGVGIGLSSALVPLYISEVHALPASADQRLSQVKVKQCGDPRWSSRSVIGHCYKSSHVIKAQHGTVNVVDCACCARGSPPAASKTLDPTSTWRRTARAARWAASITLD